MLVKCATVAALAATGRSKCVGHSQEGYRHATPSVLKGNLIVLAVAIVVTHESGAARSADSRLPGFAALRADRMEERGHAAILEYVIAFIPAMLTRLWATAAGVFMELNPIAVFLVATAGSFTFTFALIALFVGGSWRDQLVATYMPDADGHTVSTSGEPLRAAFWAAAPRSGLPISAPSKTWTHRRAISASRLSSSPR